MKKIAILINTNRNIYKYFLLRAFMATAWNKGQINKVIQICKNCKKKHEEWPSVKPDFCSRECYYKFRKKIPGPNTGKTFSKKWRENIGKAAKGKLSGKSNPNWEGGIKKFYTSKFRRKLNKLIKQRDNFECTYCYSKKNLVVHHLDWNTKNDLLNNLITLCRSCHGKLHHAK